MSTWNIAPKSQYVLCTQHVRRNVDFQETGNLPGWYQSASGGTLLSFMSRENLFHAISGITRTLNNFEIKHILPQNAKPPAFFCGMRDQFSHEYKTTALGSYDRASWANYDDRKTNKMQQLNIYYELLSQHVSDIIMPIFRRTQALLLYLVCCSGSAGCGW